MDALAATHAMSVASQAPQRSAKSAKCSRESVTPVVTTLLTERSSATSALRQGRRSMSKYGPDHVTVSQAILILRIALTQERTREGRRNIEMAIELLEALK